MEQEGGDPGDESRVTPSDEIRPERMIPPQLSQFSYKALSPHHLLSTQPGPQGWPLSPHFPEEKTRAQHFSFSAAKGSSRTLRSDPLTLRPAYPEIPCPVWVISPILAQGCPEKINANAVQGPRIVS